MFARQAANDSIPNTFGFPFGIVESTVIHRSVTLCDIIMQRLHRSKEAKRRGRTKPRKLSRPLCVDVHATQCIISRNGTLTPRLWSLCGVKSHTKRRADARHCPWKTNKLLEPPKGNEFRCSLDRNRCLILFSVTLGHLLPLEILWIPARESSCFLLHKIPFFRTCWSSVVTGG